MKIHDLIQGSQAWLAYRTQHFNASDAPAMLGCSPYKTRTELLHEMHTGLSAEVNQATQRLFDDGHRFEALARPLAEEIIGEDLYPVTGSLERLSASFDGLTMSEDIAFEHKSLNATLRAAMDEDYIAADLPLAYRVQMEQQLLVSGAGQCLFMASKWDGDELVEERHCWYLPDPELRQQIVNGWLQFAADLAAYVPPAPAEIKPVGKTPETLPALFVEVTGKVTASNLDAYKEHALAVFAGINRELTTDQHFADAEKIVKWCSDVESRLEATKEHALSQTSTIDELFKTIDDIKEVARKTRLDLNKLVEKRKDEIRAEIVTNGRAAYAEHVVALNKEITPAAINLPVPDFAGAIKGKRSLDSMRDAVDVALANGKIAADAQAKAIRNNQAIYKANAAGFEFLFADLAQLLHKDADDFALVIQSRIQKRQAEDALAKEKIEAEATAKAAAETARVLAEASKPALAPAAIPAAVLPPAETVTKAYSTMPFKSVPTAQPTLKLGDISQRLGFNLTADFLKSIGFEPAATAGASKLYHDSHFPAICNALVQHIQRVAQPLAA